MASRNANRTGTSPTDGRQKREVTGTPGTSGISAVADMEATAETPAAEKMRMATDANTCNCINEKDQLQCCLFTWILQISIFIYVQIMLI